jgi:DNA helicase-2/ATP-dependent DNA helicase PcrA
MDKKVIFAVAGSGKTKYIVDELSLDKRPLIVTYTNNNLKTLRMRISRKFGYFPSNIYVYSYFTFLYSFCYRPFLSHKFKTRGINYEANLNRGLRLTDRRYFFDGYGRIYSNRIAKFLEVQGVLGDINLRLSKYFDTLFIDEVQDLAGHDFNLLRSISQANLGIIAVGDFYQHTFDTSRDGNVNASLHDNYEMYQEKFKDIGFTVDTESLTASYRCSPAVCEFISNGVGVGMSSARNDNTNIHLVEKQEQADEIFHSRYMIKLFYREHFKYECYSRNWGECKGEDGHSDVCVVLNKTTLDKFRKNKLSELAPQTKNKFYVACSRARGDLYFVPENFYEKYKK